MTSTNTPAIVKCYEESKKEEESEETSQTNGDSSIKSFDSFLLGIEGSELDCIEQVEIYPFLSKKLITGTAMHGRTQLRLRIKELAGDQLVGSDFNDMLLLASVRNHPEICELAIKWGATNLKEGYQEAYKRNNHDASAVFKKHKVRIAPWW